MSLFQIDFTYLEGGRIVVRAETKEAAVEAILENMKDVPEFQLVNVTELIEKNDSNSAEPTADKGRLN